METVDSKIKHIIGLLSNKRFQLHNEKELQRQIESIIKSYGLPLIAEHRLSKESIIDFLCWDGIGIEVKIKGTAKDIYYQVLRYLEFDEITGIILVTNKSMQLPRSINDKPAYILNLGKSWL